MLSVHLGYTQVYTSFNNRNGKLWDFIKKMYSKNTKIIYIFYSIGLFWGSFAGPNHSQQTENSGEKFNKRQNDSHCNTLTILGIEIN